jgi:nucleotide-binding universal stress UspA family protein
MSYKTLLVHAEPEWGSSDSLIAARHVAEMFGAHVIGVGAEAFDLPSYSYVEGQLVQMIRDDIDKDLVSAKTRFDAAMIGAPHGASFVSGLDRPATLMKERARGADLIVARRPPHGSSALNLCLPADLVLGAGAPVLLAPEGAPPLKARQVLVAWKDRPEARRALADALPFLARAESVVLAAFCTAQAQPETHHELQEVAARLSRHGIQAAIRTTPPSGDSIAADLEDAAATLDADLVVAGAYSHSRMNEWVLGGVTEELIGFFGRYLLFSR